MAGFIGKFPFIAFIPWLISCFVTLIVYYISMIKQIRTRWLVFVLIYFIFASMILIPKDFETKFMIIRFDILPYSVLFIIHRFALNRVGDYPDKSFSVKVTLIIAFFIVFTFSIIAFFAPIPATNL
jgi:hypothetical protein